METEEEVIDETIACEEGIEPFDWEDLLYEAWLEAHLRKEKRKPVEAGI